LAAVLGWQVGESDLLLPGLILATAIPVFAGRIFRLAPDVLVAGLVLLGYLIGNRGFAQLSMPRVPLLPGEIALAFGLAVACWRIARDKVAPVRRDSLNAWVLLWLIACSARLPFDIRAHGFVALRDFALVYYALFFFLAQGWHVLPKARSFLEGCLTIGLALTPPITLAFNRWPDVMTELTLAGVPVIFVKGDVATSFMAAGVFWFGSRYARDRNGWWLVPFIVCTSGVVTGNSRAATVALLAGLFALPVLWEKRLTRVFATLAAFAALCLLAEAGLARSQGSPSTAFRMYESIRSVIDFSGSVTPSTDNLGDKPDNNRFRLVWWGAVIAQTREESPLVGLGFGRDLAAEFVRRYYADTSDEFNTRSPHSFVVTVFARTGLIGLVCFGGIIGAVGVRSWWAARTNQDSGTGASWLAPAVIFIAACFGVILEGPMGAILFWTLLGLANAGTRPTESVPIDRTDLVDESRPTLPTAEAGRLGGVPTQATFEGVPNPTAPLHPTSHRVRVPFPP
jgi:hypothetical protein